MKYVSIFVLFVFAATATAAVDIGGSLENPSFEQPSFVNISDGFDGATDVPGWNSDPAEDSGVEMSWVAPIPDGLWAAYLMGTDGPVWQTSSAVIADGKTYSLDYHLANTGTCWSVAPPAGADTPIPMVPASAALPLGRITA